MMLDLTTTLFEVARLLVLRSDMKGRASKRGSSGSVVFLLKIEPPFEEGRWTFRAP